MDLSELLDRTNLSSRQKAVVLMVASRAGAKNGWWAQLTIEDVQKETGLGRSQAYDVLDQLVKRGVLQKQGSPARYGLGRIEINFFALPPSPIQPVTPEAGNSAAGVKQRSTVSDDEYSEVFEAAWQLYPKRDGANSKKAAWKCWNARLKDGVPEQQLLLATKNYARHCDAKEDTGTQYVMQAQRFWGAKHDFEAFLDRPDDSSPDWTRRWHNTPLYSRATTRVATD